MKHQDHFLCMCSLMHVMHVIFTFKPCYQKSVLIDECWYIKIKE